jgi:hypothetical protein
MQQLRQLSGFLRQYVVPRLEAIWTSKRAIFATIVAVVVTLIGTLAAFTALATFAPRFSVEPTTPLDPENPFSVPFTITNTGPVKAKQVKYMCSITEATFTRGLRIKESYFVDERYKSIAEIAPEERLEAPCPGFGPGIGGQLGFGEKNVKEADMTLLLSYRGAWRPWRRTEQFRFIYMRGPDGEVRWFTQPD